MPLAIDLTDEDLKQGSHWLAGRTPDEFESAPYIPPSPTFRGRPISEFLAADSGEVQEGNPYHDEKVRFTSGPGIAGAATKPLKQGQTLDRQAVISHIMSVNPPGRVADGKMTPEDWADKYLSPEPDGYIVTKVHPDILHHPRGKDVAKVEEFADMDAATVPPIVIDSNQKLQARDVYDDQGQGYGLAPHIVIDGSHRGTAAMIRGDSSIPAVVPVRMLKQLRSESLTAEKIDFAKKYLHDKGFEVTEVTISQVRGFEVFFKYDAETAKIRESPTGSWGERTFDRIAEKKEHKWEYADAEEVQERNYDA